MKKENKIVIICISYKDSGRHYRTMPINELSDSVALMIHDDAEGNNFDASVYEIDESLWRLRHEYSLYRNAHTSHFLAKYGEEKCLGDYV